jgi:hypothetical protein
MTLVESFCRAMFRLLSSVCQYRAAFLPLPHLTPNLTRGSQTGLFHRVETHDGQWTSSSSPNSRSATLISSIFCAGMPPSALISTPSAQPFIFFGELLASSTFLSSLLV